MSVTAVRPSTRSRTRSPLAELRWFLLVAFAGSWGVAGAALIAFDLGEMALGIGVLMVAVAALAATRRDRGSARPLLDAVLHWRFAARWYAAALLLPFLALGIALLLAPPLGGSGVGPDAAGLGALLLLPLFVLLFGGPEELGWRGYALPRLQERFNALVASLLLSILWMVWHLPAFLLSDVFADIPVLPYLVIGIASSVAYTSLYNSTRGSVLSVMLLHGSVNLSLIWLPPTTLSFMLYAATWGAVAMALLWRYGPADLSAHRRHTAVANGVPEPMERMAADRGRVNR